MRKRCYGVNVLGGHGPARRPGVGETGAVASDEVRELVERWRQGDEQAARLLHDRYWHSLYDYARQQLDRRLSSRVSEEDVLQSAFRSFFRRVAEGQYELVGSNALWQLLKKITLNKIRKATRFHRAAKRDAGRDEWLGNYELEVYSRGPSPEEAACFSDVLAGLHEALTEFDAKVVALCLEGYGVQEIAERLECSRWTVRRVLVRVQAWLQRQVDGELSQ